MNNFDLTDAQARRLLDAIKAYEQRQIDRLAAAIPATVIIAAIEQGKADVAAGRVTPWADVKRELGIDTQGDGDETQG